MALWHKLERRDQEIIDKAYDRRSAINIHSRRQQAYHHCRKITVRQHSLYETAFTPMYGADLSPHVLHSKGQTCTALTECLWAVTVFRGVKPCSSVEGSNIRGNNADEDSMGLQIYGNRIYMASHLTKPNLNFHSSGNTKFRKMIILACSSQPTSCTVQ